jgi:tyrocidine synthetase-3
MDIVQTNQALSYRANKLLLIRIDKRVDIQILMEAIDRLFERHESLRAAGRPDIYHFRLKASRKCEKLPEVALKYSCRPLTLKNGEKPLYRLALAQTSEQAYYLAFVLHPSVADGFSLGILYKDLLQLYSCLVMPGGSAPSPAGQYKDFLQWQAELPDHYLQGLRYYWRSQLGGIGGPSLRERRGTRKDRTKERFTLEFPNFLMSELSVLCESGSWTMEAVLLSFVRILLQRYSQREDDAILILDDNRESATLSSMVGLLENPLIIRTYVDEGSNFHSVLEAMTLQVQEARKYKDLPFSMLPEVLNLSPADLECDAFFDFQRVAPEVAGDAGFEWLREFSWTEHAGLNFFFRESADTLRLTLVFDPSIHSSTFVRELCENLVDISASCMELPTAFLHELSIYGSSRMLKWTLDSNNRCSYPQGVTIPELFRRRVEERRDAVAVRGLGGELTYGELEELTDGVAGYLVKECGVRRGQLVGLLLARGEWQVIGILGILKAGGAYVPMDPSYPRERIGFLAGDAGLSVVLTDGSGEEAGGWSWPEGVRVVDVRGLSEKLEGYTGSAAGVEVTGEDLAYVIYTSGTTGQPKGVLVEHRNVVQLLFPERALFGFGAEDVWTMSHSYCFDFSVWELFGALLYGGRVVLVGMDRLRDGEAFLAMLEEEGVTVLCQTPSAFRNLLTAGRLQGIWRPLALRYVIFGGEALQPGMLREWKDYYPECRLVNMYGITETTVHNTYKEIGPAEIASGLSLIGRVLPTLSAYVLDRYRRPVPVGGVGELYVGGAGVSRGYLGRPELTAERFVENPYVAGERVYRSGDRVRLLEDGSLEYLGRMDKQVKIRGYRVEPGEIERVLEEQAVVRDAVVLSRGDSRGYQYLAAYVRLEGEQAVTAAELRSYLMGRLPSYMVPSHILFVSEWPLTRNGKIDQQALPEVGEGAMEIAGARDEEEAELVGIWEEVLERRGIGVRDNFFEIGGHSLLAMQLLTLLHRRLGVRPGLRELFVHATIAEQAELVRESRRQEYVPIPRAGERSGYALSSAQKRLYVLQELDRSSVAYNMPMAVRMRGEVKREKVEEVMRRLMGRHSILRTRFVVEGGELLQRVEKGMELEIAGYGWEEDLPEVLGRFVRPFDLGEGPLVRVGMKAEAGGSWVLLIDLHHIVADGRSLEVLLREFAELYGGGEPGMPGVEYRDYAQWQWEDEGYRGMLEEQRAYWLGEYTEPVEALELPADYPRPGVKDFAGSAYDFSLEEGLTAGLKTLAKEEGVTDFMLMLALYNVLLSRLSGQQDIVIGTPVEGRMHPDLRDVVGMFVNTLALRTRVEGEKTFRELLREIRERSLAAFSHQEYPYEELVEALSPARDMSRNPLFDVMLVVEAGRREPAGSEALGMEALTVGERVSKFDLTLYCRESDGRYALSFQYSTQLFGEETMGRYAECLRELAASVVKDSGLPLRELEVLPERERRRLLGLLNSDRSGYPQGVTIPELFRRRVEERRDAVAVRGLGGELTYGELEELTDGVAGYLVKECGVRRGQLVGLLLARGEWQVIGILGILKAGGAYVPMDPSYPRERIGFLAGDAGLSVVLTDGSGEEAGGWSWPEGVRVVDVRGLSEKLEGYAGSAAGVEVTGEDLAYVIYTSGTTGQPKGVLVEHRNVVQLLFPERALFGFGAGDVWTMSHSYCFDVSVWELFGALLYGGRVVLVGMDRLRDGEAFLAMLEEEGVTVLCQTPSAFRNLLTAGRLQGIWRPLALRYVIFGGEALQPGMLREWKDYYPECRLVNMYGITETTVHNTYKEIGPAEIASGLSLIGRVLPTLSAYVLDRYRRPVPVGGVGELYVGGAGVSRGYLGRPELTAERFVENPYVAGERVYRSGDRVRLLEDGSLEYLGRMDKQVKIRGYRVEPGEIERVLEEQAVVRDAVVLSRGDSRGYQYLAAYVRLEGEQAVTAAELRSYLMGRLPSYMVPSHILFVSEWPLTRNGKIDQQALPEVGEGAMEIAGARDEEEAELVGIWEEVLERRGIGVRDNFFEIGGHSLLAMQLLTLLHRRLGVRPGLRELFVHATIAEQAELVRESRRQEYVPIPRAGERSGYALSSAQKRLYVLQELDRSSVAYNMPMAVRMRGEVKREKVEEVMRRLMGRHSILRTRFVVEGGELLQRVEKGMELEIAGYGWEEDLPEVLGRFVRPFDLGEGPLVRVGMKAEAGGSWVLLIDLHHIVADGRSLEVLLREFAELYGGGEPGMPGVEYRDYAQWQWEDEGYRGMLEEQRAYWLGEYTEPVEALELPADYPRPGVKDFAGSAYDFSLEEGLTAGLKTLAKEEGVTDFMLMLALYNVLLSRLSGQQDIVIGTPVEGRMHPDLRDVVGMFVNTLALRTRVEGEKTFRELLREIRERSLAAFSHQEYPYEELVEALSPARDMSRNPLFDVMLVVEAGRREPAGSEALGMEALTVGERVSKFDLTLYCRESDGRYALSFQYSTQLFGEETMGRYAECLRELAASVVKDSGLPLRELEVLPERERRRLLGLLNSDRSGYPQGVTIPELFRRRVEERRDAVAVRGLGGELTYGELEELTDGVAGYLVKECGVRRGQLVGLLLARGEWQVIGILGILKAGGAYVPMDPSYPRERIGFLAGDAGLSVVLTDGSGEEAGGWSWPEGVRVVDVRGLSEKLEGYAGSAAGVEVTGEDLAYVIYTSGTTGQPKGVLVEHRNVVQLLFPERALFGFGAGDVWTMSHSYCFDFSVWELFGALLYGGRVVLVGMDRLRDGEAFLAMLEEEGVTVLCQTPRAFRNLPMDRRRHLKVGYLFLGGEALQPGMLREWKDYYPECRLVNLYGITEVSIINTAHEISEADINGGHASIGRVLPTLSAYVLDRYRRPVPVGGVGELYVGGAGVSRGYLGRPELTAERFVENPYVAGERVYRSGDRVRLLEDGSLEYLGRMDKQVKIRGYRVEPGEIERVLEEQAVVRDAVVLSRGDSRGYQYLAAYVRLEGEQAVTAAELRSYLMGRLPSYMVPSHILFVSEWPLTRNGKIDQQALPEVGEGAMEIAGARDEEEAELVGIWEEVLERRGIGVRDNFFEIGGHSLLAMQLLTLLHRRLGVRPGLRELFVHATIAEQAELVRESRRQEYVPIPRAGERSGYALSSAQKRLYVLQELDRSSVAYNMPMAVRMRGEVKREKVEEVMRRLMGRHSILRTRFVVEGGELLQRVEKGMELEIAGYGWEEDLPEVLGRFVRPFDLGEGPLVRVGMKAEAGGSWVLLIDLHHIVADGRSLEVLLREFAELYGGGEPGMPGVEYRDYAQWQWEDEGYRGMLEEQRAYWLGEYTEPVEALELPADYPRPPVKTYAGDTFFFVLDETHTRQWVQLAKRENATLFTLCFCVYTILLSKISGQNAFVTGVPVSGRSHPGLEDTIGMFVNMLPIRTIINPTQHVADYLRLTSKKVVAALDHQDFPFEELIGELAIPRDTGRAPLFDVSFALNENREAPLPHQMELLHFENKTSKYDLSLIGDLRDGQIHFAFQFNTDLYTTKRIAEWAGFYREMVNRILQDAGTCIGELHVYPLEKERRLFLNHNTAMVSGPGTIHSLFESQSKRFPGNTALVHEEQCMTYQELNSAANQLSRLLLDKGAGRGVIIPILAERSIEMIIGMLAILKSGSAYLPIDPDHPSDRISSILADAGGKTMLATKRTAGIVASGEGAVILIGEDVYRHEATDNPETGCSPSDLAYVIYTSGSTGVPRGIMIEHRSIMNTLSWRQEYYGFKDSDVTLQIPSFAFDSSVEDIFSMLLAGGTLVLTDQQKKLDIGYLRRLIFVHRVNYMLIVPQLYKEMLRYPAVGDLGSLKAVTLAGDSFSEDLVRLHFRVLGEVRLFNEYGPTENSVCTTAYEFDPDDVHVLIGEPITNVGCHVLDEGLHHCPRGRPGQLYIEGPGLTRGYYASDGSTRLPFVENPFDPQRRLYPTGDLVVQVPDGKLKFLGRLDQQIKVRGNRIDILEIEGRLRNITGINEALVMLNRESGYEELSAYLNGSGEIDVAQIRKALALLLPGYMIPTVYYAVDALPLNVNGKIDRTAVISGGRRLEHRAVYVSPVTDMERLVAEGWREILEVKDPGLQDNFFDLGGNSLKAIQVVHYLKERLNRDIPVLAVFEHSSVGAFAAYLKIPDDENTGTKRDQDDIRDQNMRLLDDAINNLFSNSTIEK